MPDSKILIQASSDPDEDHKPPLYELYRDRIAFFISEHQDLLYSLSCGSAMAWAAFSACSSPHFETPLRNWAIPIAIGIIILSAVELWTTSLVTAVVCTVCQTHLSSR